MNHAMIKSGKIFSLVILTCMFFQAGVCQSDDSINEALSKLRPAEQIVKLKDLSWLNRSSNPDLAIEYANRALDLSKKNNLLNYKPEILNIIGVVYRNIGELEKSYSFYKEALKLATEYGDSIQMAYSNNNIGGYYRLIGSYTKAIDYMIRALRLFEKEGDIRGTGFCAINIGILFRRQGDYKKALEYLNKTVEIRTRLNDKQGLTLTLNQIAEIHYETGNYESAKNGYEQLLTIYEEINEEKGIAAVYAGLAGVYYTTGDLNSALDYREKSLSIDRKINNKYGVITNLSNMGRIFTKLENFTEAEINLSQALELAIEAGYKDLEMSIYDYFTKLYFAKKNYKEAYEFHLKYDAIKDSLFNEEKTEIIADFETAYESDKKELENSILKQSIEKEKVYRYSSIIIFVLVLILVGVNYKRYQNNKTANKLLKELNQTKDKFFKILAHDLKNPFNTIMGYSEILIQDFHEMQDKEKYQLIKDINSSSQKLYRLLENLLRWIDTQSGTLQMNPLKLNLHSAVEDVINLFHNVALDKKLRVINKIGKDHIVFADENTLKFILRNLLNNAIKYSIPEGEILFISEEHDGKYYQLAVKDSGIGIKDENKSKIFNVEQVHSTLGTNHEPGTGLGLVLVKEFVEKNGGKIWFESEINCGTTFYITLIKSA